ncbi:MAG TPA: tetratricopeptide repeat protein [Vicinamibacterales bacterium]|nr:tetratricopeptide repeat protein [Vicinamibacterales bacterium]
MASEREEALKKAEKLLRQGKLDLAIAEYARMIEEQPRDWNTRNTLGDLYIRAAQPDKAIAQYTMIADHLMHEGFYPRAAAIYKKVLKIRPDEESVQLNLGEISAKQGLLADAKGYFLGIASKRRQRGDSTGSDEMIVRLGTLDPSDFDARALAARTLARNGDTVAAATLYRGMHADLLEKGRAPEALGALREAVNLNPDDLEGRTELARTAVSAGDLDAARPYLDRAVAGADPVLLMALMEMELRAGNLDAAREILAPLLSDQAVRARIIELAWTLAPVSAEAAFVCIDTAVDAELAAGNYMDAAAILQEFVTRVSGQIGALLKLVEICVDGGLEATMYEAQAVLADAYLEAGQGAEARVIAEDLVAREPWEHAHIDRFRRALVMLDVPDPDTVIADRLSGQGPFIATDPFMAPESFGPLEEETPPAAPAPEPPAAATEPPIEQPVSMDLQPEPEPEPEPVPQRRAAPKPQANEPDIPLRPRKPDAAPPAPARGSGGLDIDLTDVLAELQGISNPPKAKPQAAAPAPTTLEDAFKDFRTEVSKQTGTHAAGEQLTLARTYLEMGMADEAIAALTEASRNPSYRFEAASLLGRLYQKRDDLARAAEWLERAAEAPAPTANEGRELLYDLGAILETLGETARALAVLMELQADAGEYRDVAARIERLARVQTGG